MTGKNKHNSLLELRNITHRFKGVEALSNVNFSIESGEIHALVGENGAGKSTLVNIIAGILQPTEGTIVLHGEEVKINPAAAQAYHGISMVPQHVEIFPHLSIAENMFINNLPSKRGFIDYKELHQAAKSWFERFDLDLDPSVPMEELDFVQQKVIVILKALKEKSTLVILDEPTASLYLEEVDRLFSFIKELNKRGITFIYISHHLEEIFQICHRATVIRDGKVQGVVNVRESNLKKLVHLMVGEDVHDVARNKKNITGDVVLKIKDMYGEQTLKNFSLELKKGEILGILSNKSGGKDELVKQLFGIGTRKKSSITYKNSCFVVKSPEDIFSMGIYLLPEDRYRDGLFLDKPIKDNVCICSLKKNIDKFGFVSVKKEVAVTERFIQDLSIVTPSARQEVQYLSGGNQQKVVISKILNAEPEVMVLDSPTVGVDVKTRMDIHTIIKDIAGRGISVLLITSDLDEIIALSSRILILVKGEVRHEIVEESSHFNRKDIGFLMEGGSFSDEH